MEKLEDTILRNLLFDEDYTRKTLPFFRDEYFTTFSDRLIFEEIRKYFDKYSKQHAESDATWGAFFIVGITGDFAIDSLVREEAEKYQDIIILQSHTNLFFTKFSEIGVNFGGIIFQKDFSSIVWCL